MIQIICFTLLLLGGAAMATATWRYYNFLRQNREARYHCIRFSKGAEVAILLVMFFFIIGFAVGSADLFFNEAPPVFLFLALVFFVGALFILGMVQVQINMAALLREMTMDVMRSFVNSIEMKDSYLKGHSRHVQNIVQVFYKAMPQKLRSSINEAKLLDAALLHDIGKMGVPDNILNKRGPLTEEEWVEIRTHPSLGQQMLAGTCYEEIGQWVLYHHERMDGKGYHGLKAADILIEARIISIADTYSAMTTDREYRPKRSHTAAIRLMEEVAGTQLDAELVQIFTGIRKRELESLMEDLRSGHTA